jgi:hypothetical protein
LVLQPATSAALQKSGSTHLGVQQQLGEVWDLRQAILQAEAALHEVPHHLQQ